jgi:hypothetical protein
MGLGYYLVNWSKKEWVLYDHIGATTARELARDPAAAAITTWYLLMHLDDRVAFVTDSYDDWPFPDGSKADLALYREVTAEVVAELIANRVLIDEGRVILFEDEPEIYTRKLRMNGWISGGYVPSEFEQSLQQRSDTGNGQAE